ncbi:hypothetical protein ACJJIW_20800 [Microbulbifer sp. JMSA004]|uniref:hypothetical protein n=1 Tax=unclassified Microbulbifer TaxID=2619833 RepID=UPI0024AD8E37|nr:hypothetical protein [Microbulbifer sp. VAAF005]WHI46430.1 hypothetical protein P0078_22415 [Microbulbifer sp. VAAF005]
MKKLVKEHGWRIQSEYNLDAFYKGIDYDCYILEKHGDEIHMEWTNWLEWEISGEQSTLKSLSITYGL